MTSIIGFGIAFGIVFVLCWLCVVVGYCRDYYQANKEFIDSWENDSYGIRELSDYHYNTNRDAVRLRIKFPSNQMHRTLVTDINGVIITGYSWYDKAIHQDDATGNYVPVFVRRKLEEYTQQIAIMHKLKSDQNDNYVKQAW